MAQAQEIETDREVRRVGGNRRHGGPVDLGHLTRQSLGDNQLQREILNLFLVQSQVYMERLSAATCRHDWASAAHTILGSARSIGAWTLARQAESAETLSGSVRSKAHKQAMQRLGDEIATTNAFIRSLFAGAHG